MTPNGEQLVKDFGTKSGPACKKPYCALMHRGLSTIQFLCTCGLWHPIEAHPEMQNHGKQG